MDDDVKTMMPVGQQLTKQAVEVPLGARRITGSPEAISLEGEISAGVIRPDTPVEHPQSSSISSD